MFGILQKKRIQKAEKVLHRLVFVQQVRDLRRIGEEQGDIPLENLVFLYGIHMAASALAKARGLPFESLSPTLAEKAAIMVIFGQTAHIGARITDISDDQLGAVMDNGLVLFTNSNLNDPSPIALAEMRFCTETFVRFHKEQLKLLQQIDGHVENFLRHSNNDDMTALAKLVDIIVSELGA